MFDNINIIKRRTGFFDELPLGIRTRKMAVATRSFTSMTNIRFAFGN